MKERGLQPLCPWRSDNPSGIVAFKHPDCSILHAALEHEHIHIMHQAGRIRIAVHGYNTQEDVGNLLRVLETILRKV
ncbi:hypothetical protein [Verrucomicrobium spinosum]|uniref:hypothetical protein n=1 Tax=Verrucomicrobium spinosum TaxID=2736 RepID=UPI001C49218A|nr:hypothetical protein [Verrucomicrobium spinosum]